MAIKIRSSSYVNPKRSPRHRLKDIQLQRLHRESNLVIRQRHIIFITLERSQHLNIKLKRLHKNKSYQRPHDIRNKRMNDGF